ncbi:hypothetical protein [Flavobacterium sp. N3904]|nr:hypothetical protein [Flavobacterium sp. N3904]
MEKIIFGIVLLHVVAGFGWVVYKLQFQKKKSNDESKSNENNNNNN